MFIPILIYLCLAFTTVTHSVKPRLIGGSDALINDFPYQASLTLATTREHICGGTIISNRHILTAAHCFNKEYKLKDNLLVFLGHSRLIAHNPLFAFLPEKIFIHPLFRGRLDDRLHYLDDIAIVKMKKDIAFGKLRQIANLPTQDITSGTVVKLSGWGATSYGSNDNYDQLQQLSLKVITFKECKPTYIFRLYRDQFCGHQGYGIGPFNGDSGGPVVVNNTVVGIISISIPQATNYPHLFTNVYSHLKFIKNILAH